jgi:DNA-binding MarR family transcriptional regulator
VLTAKDYPVLDAIERHKPRSQRALAKLCGISLGKTNYILNRLIENGMVKVSTLDGMSAKRGNAYELTKGGLEAKAKLVLSFIKEKTKEFNDFSNRLLENLLFLQDFGVSRLLVLGSQTVGRLLAHIARREHLEIRVIGTVSEVDHFDCFTSDAYDHVLIAEDPEAFSQLIHRGLIPEAKVTYLK